MGVFSFIIGFIIGWGLLASYVSKFLPFEIGGVCLLKLGPLCLFSIGLAGVLVGVVVGIIFYMLFK